MWSYISCFIDISSHLFSAVFIFIMFSVVTGCSSSGEFASEKMDAALRQKLENLEKENSNAEIKFFGKCSDNISQEMSDELKSSGISLESIVQNIFTAKGNCSSIKKVSLMDIVTSLEMERRQDIK